LPAARQLNRRCECVRITDDAIPDPAVEALRQRLRIFVKPALVLMTGSGDVLHCNYARLYPGYDAQGREMPGWSESLLSLEDLLDLVNRVEARRRAEEKTIRALQERRDAGASVALAQIQAGRGRPERARALLEGVLQAAEDRPAREALADLLAETGNVRRAREEYGRLIRRHPADERLERWRHDAARLYLIEVTERGGADGATDPQVAAGLTTLRELAHSVEDEELAISSRLALARAAQALGDGAAVTRELAWLAPRTGPGETCRPPWTARLVLQLVELELQTGAARKHAERHGWQLVRTFPDSPEAQITKHGMLGCGLLIAAPR